MSNTTIPVPTTQNLKEISSTGRYDYENLRHYYAWINYKKRNGSNSEYRKTMTSQILEEYADGAGFKEWLNSNFVKNPGFLKQTFRVDDDYKPIYSDANGRYYQFNESELEYGGFGNPRPEITNNDIIHDYGESLKDQLMTKGQTLVKVSNGKWRVYLNGSSAPSGSTSNIASTTSTDSNSSTTSSTNSAPSTSNTSTINSTTGSSSTSRINSTTGTNTTSSISSTTNTSPTTDSSSITSTDSTTRSFDFLDDVLGTQKEASKDKTTEVDPNQIANTIVNDTKLNDTAISNLVSTYLNSLYRINKSYNTQPK